MITDYQSLQDSVAAWLKRETETDFTDQIPTFIQLAENEMCTGETNGVALRAREMQFRARAKLNEEYEWLPGADTADSEFSYLEVDWISLLKTDNSGKITETLMDGEDLPGFLKTSSSGDPKSWMLYNEQVRFRPPPTGNEDPPLYFQVYFYGRFKPLSAGNTSNDILERYPQIYLYGTLLQAEGYVQNDQRIALWRNNYLGGIMSANVIAESGRRGTMAIGVPE